VILILGVNFMLWGIVGLMRFTDDRIGRKSRRTPVPQPPDTKPGGSSKPLRPPVALADVAVLMAAHNEEVVIEDSLTALVKLIPPEQIFIVSDASTDQTVALARGIGVNVIETETNVGKAGALSQGIESFGLLHRFQAVLLLDADTRLDSGYFNATLPLFDDPAIVAVAGCAHSDWQTSGVSFVGRLLLAHRSRLYSLTQRLLKYGQTWRASNRTHIVPGFASLYRTEILGEISIDAPGMVIEDFNMTFEVYRKRLGRVGFTLDGIAVTQDPNNLRDYTRQVKRWALGLWQTVRRHRLRWDLFSVMLVLLLAELLVASVMLVLLPFIVLVLIVPDIFPQALAWPWEGDAHAFLAAHISLTTIAIGVLVPDYLLTCGMAIAERKPRYLFYGIFFVFVRIIDASLALYTLPAAWREKSSGRWVSPTRRDLSQRTADEANLTSLSAVHATAPAAPTSTPTVHTAAAPPTPTVHGPAGTRTPPPAVHSSSGGMRYESSVRGAEIPHPIVRSVFAPKDGQRINQTELAALCSSTNIATLPHEPMCQGTSIRPVLD
jgi:cellulose synthase/poly-beta-1,6-N-acetylglucosamine synthase-like glycosyltransferase